MAFCNKCGCSVSDDAKTCPSCGAKLCGDSFEDKCKSFINTTDHSDEFSSEDMSSNKAVNALAYLGITFWLPLAVNNNSASGHFHANQGLLVFIVMVILSVLCTIFGKIIILGSIINAIAFIISAFYVLFGVINVLNDKAKEIPLIGKIHLLK